MKIRILMAILCVAVLLCSLASCGGCKAHVDADDDLACDNCGEVYDDGITVTFTVTFEDGKPLSGKTLILDDQHHYELTLDENGQVTFNVFVGIYEASVDGYLLNVDLIKVKKDTTEVSITAMDNIPDGSREKPFYITESQIELTLAPGEEIFYNYRGTTIKYASVKSEGVVINYNGESFEAVDGEVMATIQPGTLNPDAPEAGRTTIFSVKNVSSEAISVVLYFEAPEGSSENPFVLEENELTVTVNSEIEYYYVFTADKNGTLVLTVPFENNDVTLTKVVEGNVPIVVKTSGATEAQIEVKAGDRITIKVSADQTADVEISLSLEIR